MKYITLTFKCGGKVKLPANIFKSINLPDYLIENNENNGSNVELITLNATENKTYNAPNNKAYNKVITKVPNAFKLGDTFNEILYDITGKIFRYDEIHIGNNNDDYIKLLLNFNSSTGEFDYELPGIQGAGLFIDDLDGWYTVKGKTLLDIITSNIPGLPNPLNETEEESVVNISQCIDIIMQCPIKINNNEIYLIHIFNNEELIEEPTEEE